MAALGRPRAPWPSISIMMSLLFGLVALASAVQSATKCPGALQPSYSAPVVANGWSYGLVVQHLKHPRGIVFDSKGALLVIDSGVGLVRITLDDSGGTCVKTHSNKTLVQNKDLNHGLALSKDGRTIYASTSDKVYAWPYSASSGTIQTAAVRTVVENMNNDDHTSRTLMLSSKHPDLLLVSRGSQSNVDYDAANLTSGHSQIRAYNISRFAFGSSSSSNPKSYDFLDGKLLGWGLRNSVGVVEHPKTGGIWSVENSVDNLMRQGKDIHTDNPGEELNFHGYLNGSHVHQGGNYGYPLCFAVWSTQGFPSLGSLKTGDQFAADRQTGDASAQVTVLGGGQLTDAKCNNVYVPPILAFQAHTAPLDIKFDEQGSTAYVSFHGSWDRAEPVGYEISAIAFKDGHPDASHNSQRATTPIIRNPNLSVCPNACFRPVGLAWDAKGRLWFTSDSTGEIFVLQHSTSNSKSSRDEGQQSGGGEDDSAAGRYVPHATSAVLVTLAAFVMGFFLA